MGIDTKTCVLVRYTNLFELQPEEIIGILVGGVAFILVLGIVGISFWYR